MLTNPPVPYDFQPGEGPSGGLLRDCTTSPINRFAALINIKYSAHKVYRFTFIQKLGSGDNPSPESFNL